MTRSLRVPALGLLLLTVALVLPACSHNYQDVALDLTPTGNQRVAVAVEDWTLAIARALESRGFQAEPLIVTNALDRTGAIRRLSESGAPRSILIGVKEWQVNARRAGALRGDVHLEVLDASGNVIAESRALGRNDLGFALEGASHARDATLAAYKATLEQLVNDPKVTDALR
jgi:hypothetical protein